ncbi:MAG: ABC transporter permease [Thermoplasmata archaeon]|nr:ABC transporter permease [Thermoplasmata archaeon]MCI4359161.1 ABC transporter permease [Thermoplasmata archaeon]
MTTPPASTPATPTRAGRRPSPQLAQIKRTVYFLSRNTLAIVGLAIILFFLVVAVWGFFYPAPSDKLAGYCGTTTSGGQGNPACSLYPKTTVCTYPSGSAPPGPNCYPVESLNPSQIAPTVDLARHTLGPLPFGSLSIDSSNPYFYNPFDGIVKGAEWSLGISAGIVGTGALIGLMLGAIAGYFGGYTDEIVMRFTDIFLSIPGLLLILVILAVIGSTISTLEGRIVVLMGAFIITWWPLYTRIVRGQVLVTREQKYVEASKASGARSGRIILRHIIPNSMYPVFVQMSLDVGSIPLALGGIVFLGFNIFPTLYFPEWGTLAALSVITLPAQLTLCSGGPCVFPWWQVLFPGLVLFLFAISVNFLSDGLRDALDPRLRR